MANESKTVKNTHKVELTHGNYVSGSRVRDPNSGTILGGETVSKPGTILDLPEAEAKKLVELGVAKYVTVLA